MGSRMRIWILCVRKFLRFYKDFGYGEREDKKMNHRRYCVWIGMLILTLVMTACQGNQPDSVLPEDVTTSEKEEATMVGTSQETDFAEDADTASDGDGEYVDMSEMDDPWADAYADVKIYPQEEYGTLSSSHQSTIGDDGEEYYYYEIEEYYFNDMVANSSAINDTLREIYQEIEASYEEAGASYLGYEQPDENTPYNIYKFFALYYVGEDYVSLVYNDVYYLGGAHPYSNTEGITIDVRTGERVSASDITGQDTADLMNSLKVSMGTDEDLSWDDVDFYITNTTIVYFYRQPGFYENVSMPR